MAKQSPWWSWITPPPRRRPRWRPTVGDLAAVEIVSCGLRLTLLGKLYRVVGRIFLTFAFPTSRCIGPTPDERSRDAPIFCDPARRPTIDDDGGQWISKIEPRRYQTNANLSQRPTKGADRPVREYVTNVR